MSLFNDIGSAVGSLGRQRTGGLPLPGQDDDAAATRRALTPAGTFATTFRTGMGTVLADVSTGVYEDSRIRDQLDAFESRLRERALASRAAGAANGSGATAVPMPGVDSSSGHGSVRAGGGSATPATHTPAPAAGEIAMSQAERRELLDLQRQQAHGRAARVSSSVRARFAGGFSEPAVASADVRTFRPRTEPEAKAFAERIVVEMTESAARLEAVATDLELARHDAAAGKPGAAQDVTRLQQEHARLERYVVDVARVVDEQSNESVSRSSASDQTGGIGKVVGEAVRNGIDHQDLQRLTKAMSLAQDEARTGNSQQLNHVQHMLRQEMVSAFLRQQVQHDRNRAETQRREGETQNAERRADARRSRHAGELEAAGARAAQRNADLMALYMQAASERRAAQQA